MFHSEKIISLPNLLRKNGEHAECKVRLVGDWFIYSEAQARDAKTHAPKPFPDSDINPTFTRIGDANEELNIWHQMGYYTTPRYAINCIDREDNDVKIITFPRRILKAMGLNPDNDLGKRIAKDIIFKADLDAGVLGGINYEYEFAEETESDLSQTYYALDKIFAQSEVLVKEIDN